MRSSPHKIERRRRHHHAQPRNVREDHFAALAVINPAARQVSADRHAHHRRAFEMSRRTPAQVRQLVAQLHHRRPDVIEELNLRDRLQPAHRHSQRAPHDARLGNRRVEHAHRSESPLQAGGRLENAALPFHAGQIFFAPAIGHVLAEHDDPLVARHFIRQRGGNNFHHGLRLRDRSAAGLPANFGAASNCAPVGSTSGEYTIE